MAATATVTKLSDGPRKYSFLVNIEGDGSGEIALSTLIDASAQGLPEDNSTRIARIKSMMPDDHSATLLWDATADVLAWVVTGYDTQEFELSIGGLKNAAGAGVTGDILIRTDGWGTSNADGSFVLTLSSS